MARQINHIFILFAAVLLLFGSGCGARDSEGPDAEPPSGTPALTQPTPETAVEVVRTDTPSPTPAEPPETLVICIGAEPESLYIYGSNMLVQQHVLNAIYDGPIDLVSFEPRAVILEEIPSLANGDALLEPTTVRAGDLVVDASGEVATLAEGIRIRPAGCRSDDCAVDYTQGEVEMDQLSADFSLLPNLLWSDGAPLTAGDSVFSFRTALETAALTDSYTSVDPYALDRTASYEAVDRLTIRWTGLPGFHDQDYHIRFWHPLPEHLLGSFTPRELLEAEESAELPIGWGAYVIDDWQIGSHMSLHRNPNYFRASEGLPRFDRLIFRFVSENSALNIARLINGECDVVDQDAALDDSISELAELDHEGYLNVVAVPGTVFEHLDFSLRPVAYDDGYQIGTDRPDYFSDPLVRQAMVHCLDRQAINDVLFGGRSEVYNSYVPLDHPLYNADGPVYRYSVQTGRDLLESAGWVDHDDDMSTPRIAQGVAGIWDGTTFAVSLITTTASTRQTMAEIIQTSMAGCGLNLDIQYWEAAEFFADGPDGPVFGRRFDLALFAWLTDTRPPCEMWLTEEIPGTNLAEPFNPWTGWNAGGYSDPEFDEACRAALESLPGETAYTSSHLLAQQVFMENLPVIPLVARLKIIATGPDLCGLVFDTSSASEMMKIEEFDRGDTCR